MVADILELLRKLAQRSSDATVMVDMSPKKVRSLRASIKMDKVMDSPDKSILMSSACQLSGTTKEKWSNN